jgi:hypothetical protein
MPGQWDEALGLLLPAMSAADQAAQNAQTREAWLAQVAVGSNQLGHAINDAVGYFLSMVTQHRPDVVTEILNSGAYQGFKGLRGYVTPSNRFGVVRWHTLINYREWPDMPSGGHFSLQMDGRWFFGYMHEYGSDFIRDKEITVYGFNEQGQFVPSSFPLVEYGTVVTIAQLSILALLHHYKLPLPS